MNFKKIYAIAAAAAVAVPAAFAQQTLTKEIVVEREIEPSERAANRPAWVSPSLYRPAITAHKLNIAQYDGTGTIRPFMPRLNAVAWNDTIAVSHHRGYAAIGYFPMLNLGVSAGYTIIDRKRETLGAWLQYDGSSYKTHSRFLAPALAGTADADDKVSVNRHVFRIGVDGEGRYSFGTVGVNATYMIGAGSQPDIARDYDQTATSAALDLSLTGRTDRPLGYWAGLSVGGFGYDKNMPGDMGKAAGDFTFGARGGLSHSVAYGSAGLDVDAAFQRYSRTGGYFATDLPGMLGFIGEDKASTLGVVRLTPYYTLTRGTVSLKLGVNAAIGLGEGKKFHLSPDVSLSFAPIGGFAVWAKATGGMLLNTMASVYDITPFQPSAVTYGKSRYNDVTGGITVGPFASIALDLWGGYNIANDWLMISRVGDYDMLTPQKIKGLHYGAKLSWQMRDIVRLYAGVEGAPNTGDKGYSLWRDHAKFVTTAGVSVKPFEKLTVSADWQLRTHRKAWLYTPGVFGEAGAETPMFAVSETSLHEANKLNISASYRLTPVFTIFANVENVLGKRWFVTPQIESAPVHGLAGVSLVF